MTNSVIYITRGQVSEAFQPKFDAWYPKHAQDVVRAGFLAARTFRSDGFPLNCNIYEIESTAVFETEAYMSMRETDPFLKELVAEYTYNTRACYDQVATVGAADEPLSIAPPLSGQTLSLFHLKDSEDTVIAWFRSVFIGCARSADVQTYRLWRNQARKPETTGEWIAVIEWPHMSSKDMTQPAGATHKECETVTKLAGYKAAGGVERVG